MDEPRVRELFERTFRFLSMSDVRPIEDAAKESAFIQVMNYFRQNREEMRRVIQTEGDVSVEKDGYILIGKVDLIMGSDLPAPRPGSFFVYVLECEDGTFCIGHTEDLYRRWMEHLKGTGAEWTRRHKPIRIAHYEEFPSRKEAALRKRALKTGYGRKYLKRLIQSGRARQAGGKLELLDFKTSERSTDPALLAAYEDQLCTYAHILEQRHGRRPERRLLYWTAEPNKRDALMEFSYRTDKVADAARRFDAVVKKIQGRDFRVVKVPERKVCKECDLSHYCIQDGLIRPGTDGRGRTGEIPRLSKAF